jgi:heme/copper-type cytochrome/quinol oxidase subunit 3
VEVEAQEQPEAPKAVAFWWKQKRKRQKCAASASILFQRFLLTKSNFFQILFAVYLNLVKIILVFKRC